QRAASAVSSSTSPAGPSMIRSGIVVNAGLSSEDAKTAQRRPLPPPLLVEHPRGARRTRRGHAAARRLGVRLGGAGVGMVLTQQGSVGVANLRRGGLGVVSRYLRDDIAAGSADQNTPLHDDEDWM